MLKNEPVMNTPAQKLVAYLLSAMLIGFIGWYNPGRVLVKKAEAEPIKISLVTLTELPKSFTSRPASSVGMPVRDIKRNFTENVEPPLKPAKEEMLNFADDENQMPEDENASDLATYVTSSEVREFSIPQTNIVIAPANLENYPYVPSSSFSYNIVEDTSYPKKYISTVKDIKAKEALNKTVRAMQEINWQRLENEMKASGKKLDVVKLQKELIKALEVVDWKKINDDAESNLDESSRELINHQFVFRTQLEKYQNDRTIQQEKLKKAQQAIIQDRLEEKSEELKNEENSNRKSSTSSKKKIVYI
jgi:hypothetical protein